MSSNLELNIVSPDNLEDPYPLYQELQASDPVHWSEPLQAWFVTQHADVTNLFRDTRLSAARTEIFAKHQLRGLDTAMVKDYLKYAEKMMLMSDGAQHTRLRRQGNAVFTAAALDGYCPMIRKIVNDLLDRVQETGKIDAVLDLSSPFPSRVMTELYAIPDEDRESFQNWTRDVARFFGASLGDDVEQDARAANQGMLKLAAYLGNVVEKRHGKGGKDMLSLLLTMEEEGRMDAVELIANAVLILSAGHVTITDQLANGIHDLLAHPEVFMRLRQDLALLPAAVEEILRYTPAVPFSHRIATADIELHGKTIEKGQLVFLGIAAANRDPRVFPEPQRFDITRQNTKHLSFAFGPHLCLGAGLARRELAIALEALLCRMPGLRFSEERPPRPKYESLVFRGFYSLPLSF